MQRLFKFYPFQVPCLVWYSFLLLKHMIFSHGPDEASLVGNILNDSAVSDPPSFENTGAQLLSPILPLVTLPVFKQRVDLRFLEVVRPAVDQFLQMETKGFRAFVFIGVSGAGKTASLMSIARQRFSIFMECGKKSASTLDFIQDSNFHTLVDDISMIHDDYKGPSFSTAVDFRILVEYCARLLLLLKLSRTSATLTPEQYLLSQLNGGRAFVDRVVELLLRYPYPTVKAILHWVCQEASTFLQAHRQRQSLVFIIDEANVGYNELCLFFESSNRKKCRGLVSPILQAINSFPSQLSIQFIISGTKISLSDGDNVKSDIGKLHGRDLVRNIYDFPPLENGYDQLRSLLDLSAINLQDNRWFIDALTAARPRLVASVVQNLGNDYKIKELPLKERVLEATRAAVKSHRFRLFERLRDLLCGQPNQSNRDEKGDRNSGTERVSLVLFVDLD